MTAREKSFLQQASKPAPLVLFLALLSMISGYLMSMPSLIGRVGMDLFYKQYRFLKVWWQGALVVFIILLVLLIIQGFLQKRFSGKKAVLIHLVLIMLALTGFYFTYHDFHSTTTHRWLKDRFHIGAYLFWLGWVIISGYYIFRNRKQPLPV